MPTDDDLEAAVKEVMLRIVGAESARAANTRERGRGCSYAQAGDRFRLVVPIGYESVVEPLVQQYGDRLTVEFDDIGRVGDDDLDGPGGLDRVLDDLHWREHTGDNAERVFREAVRRAMALAQGGSPSRAIILVTVLNRLGELSGFDTSDLWTRT